MKKKCVRCASAFVCREDRSELCQCKRVYMVPGSMDFVRDNFDNCLCASCLAEISKSFNAFGVNPKFATKEVR